MPSDARTLPIDPVKKKQQQPTDVIYSGGKHYGWVQTRRNWPKAVAAPDLPTIQTRSPQGWLPPGEILCINFI